MTMTTEEKKCLNCGATWGQIFNNPHECSGGELPRKRHVFPDLTATPPETGKEWWNMKVQFMTAFELSEQYKVWAWIETALSSALAQGEAYKGKTNREWYSKGFAEGEKHGAEKERERIRKLWNERSTEEFWGAFDNYKKITDFTHLLMERVLQKSEQLDALKG